MAEILVTPISSGRDERLFIRFQWEIYKGNPYWVPPLLMDRKKLIDRKKNPFYSHADAEFFLARRNGKIVGRIAAIINPNHDREHNERMGFFGFFECIDDQEVADALFATVKDWVGKRGATALRGPASPSVNDEYGLLVDGFEKPPAVLMPYNPPYYGKLIEGVGLKKEKDLFAFALSQDTVHSERLLRVTDIVRRKEGLTFRSINMKDFDAELQRVRQLYNRAWQYNWGAVPMTEEEFLALAKDLKPIVEPELVIIAERKGEPIGFALSIPDLNQALIHNKRGYLLPGLYSLMRYKKKIDRVRIIVLGVVREYLPTGAAAVLFLETAIRANKCGYRRGEAGWVLEDNSMMIRAAELLNGVRDKTFRLYQTTL